MADFVAGIGLKVSLSGRVREFEGCGYLRLEVSYGKYVINTTDTCGFGVVKPQGKKRLKKSKKTTLSVYS